AEGAGERQGRVPHRGTTGGTRTAGRRVGYREGRERLPLDRGQSGGRPSGTSRPRGRQAGTTWDVRRLRGPAGRLRLLQPLRSSAVAVAMARLAVPDAGAGAGRGQGSEVDLVAG